MIEQPTFDVILSRNILNILRRQLYNIWNNRTPAIYFGLFFLTFLLRVTCFLHLYFGSHWKFDIFDKILRYEDKRAL